MTNFEETKDSPEMLASYSKIDNDLRDLCLKLNAKIEVFSQSFQRLTLMCSGGIDSTALLGVFCKFTNAKNKFSQIQILHVNYSLRGQESDADQSFVQDLCKEFRVECRVFAGENILSRDGLSIQVWARKIRRLLLSQLLQENPRTLFVTAHQADDLAESILFRAGRGSSSANLCGMSEFDKPIWRPFLHVSRGNIEKFSKSIGVIGRQDSSNLETKYTRNKIRHGVMKVLDESFPGAAERIARVGAEAAEIADFAKSVIESQILSQESGHAIPLEWLLQQNPSVFNLAAAMLFEKTRPKTDDPIALSSSTLRDMQNLMREHTTSKKISIYLPAGLSWTIDKVYARVETRDKGAVMNLTRLNYLPGVAEGNF